MMTVLITVCPRVSLLHDASNTVYFGDELQRVADISSSRWLRSLSMSALIVLPTWLSTVGDRAFPVAASRIWNSPPLHVTSAPSLQTSKKTLKPFLFSRSFPPEFVLFFVSGLVDFG